MHSQPEEKETLSDYGIGTVSFFNIRYSTFQDSGLGFSLMKACSRVDPQKQPSPRPGYSPHCNKNKLMYQICVLDWLENI